MFRAPRSLNTQATEPPAGAATLVLSQAALDSLTARARKEKRAPGGAQTGDERSEAEA